MKILLPLLILFGSCRAKHFLSINKKASNIEVISGDVGLGGEENKDSAIIFVEIYSYSVGHLKKFTQANDKKVICTINEKDYQIGHNNQIIIKVPKGKLKIMARDDYFFHYPLAKQSFYVGGNSSYNLYIYLLCDPNLNSRKIESKIKKNNK